MTTFESAPAKFTCKPIRVGPLEEKYITFDQWLNPNTKLYRAMRRELVDGVWRFRKPEYFMIDARDWNMAKKRYGIGTPDFMKAVFRDPSVVDYKIL